MKIIIKCDCGCKDFDLTDWNKYAICKVCGERIYLKDLDFEIDFEDYKINNKESM